MQSQAVVQRAAAKSSSHKAVVEPKYLWTKLHLTGDPPPNCCCHSGVLYKDRYIIVFGGGSRSTSEGVRSFNTVYQLDLQEGRWQLCRTVNSEIVHPRVAHSAVVYGDKMLVYGGHPVMDEPICFDELLELDLVTWTWKLLHNVPSEPDGPGERHQHAAVVYRDRMYILMGTPCPTASALWYLDLQDYSWHAVPPTKSFCAPHVPLAGHSASVDGDYLYVFGGEQRSNAASVNGFGVPGLVSYSNVLYRYHFATNEWVVPFAGGGAACPAPRYACAMVVLEGCVYVFGGDSQAGRIVYDDFWQFDTSAVDGHWAEVSRRMRYGPLDKGRPSRRTGMACVLARGAMYVLGGEVADESIDEAPAYTNETFRCPLAPAPDASLRENSAMWLSGTSLLTRAALTALPRLPCGLRRLLASYIPNCDERFGGNSDDDASDSSEELTHGVVLSSRRR